MYIYILYCIILIYSLQLVCKQIFKAVDYPVGCWLNYLIDYIQIPYESLWYLYTFYTFMFILVPYLRWVLLPNPNPNLQVSSEKKNARGELWNDSNTFNLWCHVVTESQILVIRVPRRLFCVVQTLDGGTPQINYQEKTHGRMWFLVFLVGDFIGC